MPLVLPPTDGFAGDDWPAYQAGLYAHFRKDFLLSVPNFNGRPVRAKVLPPIDSLRGGFVHAISSNVSGQGDGEGNRTPELKRCARIRWIRPVIEAVPPDVLSWRNIRGTARRAVISLPDFSYIVILDERRDYF